MKRGSIRYVVLTAPFIVPNDINVIPESSFRKQSVDFLYRSWLFSQCDDSIPCEYETTQHLFTGMIMYIVFRRNEILVYFSRLVLPGQTEENSLLKHFPVNDDGSHFVCVIGRSGLLVDLRIARFQFVFNRSYLEGSFTPMTFTKQSTVEDGLANIRLRSRILFNTILERS